MDDITPGLIEAVTTEFRQLYRKSSSIQSFLEKISNGTATYAEAQGYSIEVSQLIGKAYNKHVSSAVLPDGRMYFNIAKRLLPSTLDENFNLVADYSFRVQQQLNRKANIGLKAQKAKKNQDRIDGLVDLAASSDRYDDVSEQLLTAFENFSQNVVDDTIKANFEFQGKAGLRPQITRSSESKCCEWCSQLAGSYDYPNVPDDVYRRHERCKCTVLFDPNTGRRQNVWSKGWTI